MTITTVASSTFIADTLILLRDKLRSNITDPISSTRPSTEKFVMTSYPDRAVRYPLITLKLQNVAGPNRLGMQSELMTVTLPVEIRVWARNEKEKDELSQQVIEYLRGNQLDSGGTIEANLHDFRILSAVDVPEASNEDGKPSPKSRVISVAYFFILGS